MDVVDAGLRKRSGQFEEAGEAHRPTSPPTGVIERVLFDRKLGAVVAIAIALAFAPVSAWWTPRGPVTTAGKSYPAIDPTETLTLDRMMSDTIEVTDYLRDRFGEDRIHLVGQSWGSTLGALLGRAHRGRWAG